ncbi:MAG: EAL domain-containing response regulator [Methylacidiphilales bacterium]|nr:EAL domain-containing response regulator [Candidatus Methylacidiphilales bacterium]
MTKILVIEDEVAVRENLLELLEAENFETIEAENGQIGIEKAICETPDLILCDLMMPEIDGFGVLTSIRSEPRTATIPFIFLTAKSAKGDFRQGMDLGADDYITKPFTRAELLSAIISRLSKQALLRKYLTAKNDIKTLAPEIQIIESSLRQALEKDDASEFEIFYKPIIEITSGKIIASESFLTWNSSDLGKVHPSELIPLAESTDLIIPLADCLLKSVCQQIKTWKKAGLPTTQITVNLSAQQFNQVDLAAKINDIISKYQVEPENLQIEISENAIMTDLNRAIATIDELKSLGIKSAIDDFGTGNSSLIYLKKLPIDILKIDPYFIHNVANDLQKSAITNALIQMAHNLNLKIVAQGVKSQAELDYVRQKGCYAMQGSLFGNALSSVELEKTLLVSKNLA